MTDGAAEEPARCSARSAELAESLHGTASTVRGWVFLEEPGPWGADALRDSRLDPELAAALSEQARKLRLRVVLIRSHLRTRSREEQARARRCLLARTGPGEGWVEEALLDHPAEVLDLDLEALAQGRSLQLPRVDHGLYLVCTQGRHDPCCAELGRPVARALAGQFPEQTWEVSHIGGDRFAGNVLVLPHGLYFGRVPPESAVPVARAYERGEVEPAYLRGRCAYGFAVQMAECWLREKTGIRGVDALPLVSAQRSGAETEAVFAAPDGGSYHVRVHTGSAEPARTLTCHARQPATPPEQHILDVRHEPA